MFLQQLSCLVDKFRISDSSSLALPFEDLELRFRSLWAENGDHLSTLYAGSRFVPIENETCLGNGSANVIRCYM